MALARAEAERASIAARIAALDAAAAQARNTGEAETDAAFLAAQDGFAQFAARRRAELCANLARSLASWRACRDAAALSFGRSRVLDQVTENAVRKSDADRARRRQD